MRWIGGGGSEDRDVDESFVRDWELWRGGCIYGFMMGVD